MAYFPMYIDLKNKKCVIVGGGTVALRKIQTLQKFAADISVFAPAICEEIRELLEETCLHQREAGKEELTGATLVIAATDKRGVNHQIACWCQEMDIPVNVIDAPEECTFLFPSVVTRGDICIGINTAGQSPIVSKKIRQEVEKAVPKEYTDIVAQLAEVKKYAKAHILEEKERRALLREIAGRAFEKGSALDTDELQQCLGERIFNIEGK